MLRRTCTHPRFTAVACVLALAVLTGCASTPSGPAIDAPQFVIGDRWQYRIVDNLRRGAVSTLDAEVIALTGGSARIRFGYSDDYGRRQWIDEVDDQGGLRYGMLSREAPRPFDP